MNKKISCLFVALILVFSAVSASATPLSLSYGNGDIFSADPTGADSLSFYLDGKYIGDADSSGTIAAPALDGGKHSLKAVATYPDGTAVCDEAVFNSGVRAVVVEQTDTFDDENNIGFTLSDGSRDHTFSYIDGRYHSTTDNNDKALQLIYNITSNFTSGMSTITTKTFKNYTKGVAEIEFDIKLTNIRTALRFQYLSTWGSNTDLVSASATKWPGTDCALTTDWQHVKFIIDNEAGTVSFEVDGDKTDVYNKDITYKGNHSVFKIGAFQSGISAGESGGGFAIDNFHAVNYIDYTGITAMEIVEDGAKVRLVLDTPIGSTSITKDDITLDTSDGQQIGVADVEYSDADNSLTLTPSSTLPKGCELVATIKEGIVLADSSKTQNTMTASVDSPSDLVDVDVSFSVNGGSLYTAKQIGAGDKISAQVTADALSLENDFYAILTLRKDKRLVSMDAKPVSIQSGESVTLQLPEIASDGDYEVYLMTCDNFDSAVALSRIYKITD